METKKSKKADLEKKRTMFFLFGLLISLSSIFFAFEWKTPVQKAEVYDESVIESSIEEMTPITREEKKVIQQKKEIIEFVVVENDPGVDDNFVLFNPEIDEGEAIKIENYLVNIPVEKEDAPPTWFPEEMPEFPGGMPSLLKFISSSVKYPVVAQENGIQGKVIITFVIDKNGDVTNVHVFRGIDPALDAEAIRVVRNLPRWKPGKQNGKPVRVNYNVPINFVLQ